MYLVVSCPFWLFVLSYLIVIVAVAQLALLSLVFTPVAEVVRQREVYHIAVVFDLRVSAAFVVAAVGEVVIDESLRMA